MLLRTAAALLLASFATHASADQTATGKKLFLADCSSCHLASGVGGVNIGNVQSADLQAPGLEQTYNHSDKLILRAILYARDQDNAPLNKPMPAWQGKLTVAQARDIIAYLKTLHS